MIHIYGKELPFMAPIVSAEFNDRIQLAYDDPDNNYVVGYPDQTDRIALNLSASDEFTNVLHPGGLSSDGVDPTQYAVFIGSYGCKHVYYILHVYLSYECICCECTCISIM